MLQDWDFDAEVESQIRSLVHDLVVMESPSGDASGIHRVMERLLPDLFTIPDITVSWHQESGFPLLDVSRGTRGALLLGHADTVWAEGTLTTMPWYEDQDAGKIFGPGILDMKAGLAIAVFALRGIGPTTPFRLLVTPDEEIGSRLSRGYIEASAKKASLVLVLESGMPEGGLKIARAGVGDFTCTVTGKESHAGLEPGKGASAVREMAQQVMWLDTLENRILGTTVNPGVISGGTRSNVVAGQASLAIDVRVRTLGEMQRIENTLAHPPVFNPGTEVHYHGEFNRPPMELGGSAHEWFRRAQETWQDHTAEPLEGRRVGGASDGNFTAEITPTLDGLGAVGAGPHARHEQIEWRYMAPRVGLVRELVDRAGGTL